ncbi:MAG: hypothetical protein ACKO2P_14115 [Planctomycetota bacterium]
MNTDVTWLRPTAATTGMLLLWQLEALQKHPPRPQNPSRKLHAIRNLTLSATSTLVLRATTAGFTTAVMEYSTAAQMGKEK